MQFGLNCPRCGLNDVSRVERRRQEALCEDVWRCERCGGPALLVELTFTISCLHCNGPLPDEGRVWNEMLLAAFCCKDGSVLTSR